MTCARKIMNADVDYGYRQTTIMQNIVDNMANQQR